MVDRYGNALYMTTTVESSLGNCAMVRGFLLNHELTALHEPQRAHGS